MFSFISNLFGTQSQRTLKVLKPYVEKINTAYQALHPLSHDALRAQTQALKDELKAQLVDIHNKIIELKKEATNSKDLVEKKNLFSQVDKAQKTYDDALEKVLIALLPQAFAIVKETARRFKENKELYVEATEYDKLLAKEHKHIKIVNGKACWKNTWQAGGQDITWDMVHYDVQLMGGIVLHQGKIAEMATGEGKTLVATLPAFLNALAGKGVHIVTVNDYLAKRDAEWMAPIYQFHGLTVDCIDKHPSHSAARKQAYLADITYGTNNEFGFDYLRDNMATSFEEKVQRGHHFAMVDEVDSVLIDDARTPLIISGPAAYDNTENYDLLKPRVEKLYKAQQALIIDFLNEAKQKIKDGNKEEGGLALFRVYRGLPKYLPLIQYLSEKGIKKLLANTEDIYLEENHRRMPEADAPLLFTIDEKNNSVELTDKGIEYLTKQDEDPQFFVLPDMATQVASIEYDSVLIDHEKLLNRGILTQDYSIKAGRIHIVNQLLRAFALYEKDVDYVVMNRRVKIVDEKTGRILSGRRYSHGLHQAIEAKEGVRVENPSQTYATITPQNQFRMYHKLAGMTGTAETEAAELWDIYKLEVVVVPTHEPVIREDKDDKIYNTKEEKLDAIVEEVARLRKAGRPVLVGTSSVESSEQMRKKLKLRPQQVLNAKNHHIESKIVARAGQEGTVTVVTHMAGRGTDIKLSSKAKGAGGLAIIGAERHENRRVDRQLRGRAGRQGDPGSSQFFISLEDKLMAHFRHGIIGSQMDKIFQEKGEAIEDSMITGAIGNAQKRLEQNDFSRRKRLLQYDDVMNMQRKVIYKKRDHALSGERLALDVMHMLYSTIVEIVKNGQTRQNYKSFQLDIMETFGMKPPITAQDLAKKPEKKLVSTLYQTAYSQYIEKRNRQKALIYNNTKGQPPNYVYSTQIPFPDGKAVQTFFIQAAITISKGEAGVRAVESTIMLHYIDEQWKNHLQRMDELKTSVRNAVYEQKDPLLIYKFEALEIFKQLMSNINKATIRHLFAIGEILQKHNQQQEKASNNRATANLRESKQGYEDGLHEELARRTPVRSTKIANRNQRVSVRYTDGTIKENVKFKTVAADLEEKRCVLL